MSDDQREIQDLIDQLRYLNHRGSLVGMVVCAVVEEKGARRDFVRGVGRGWQESRDADPARFGTAQAVNRRLPIDEDPRTQVITIDVHRDGVCWYASVDGGQKFCRGQTREEAVAKTKLMVMRRRSETENSKPVRWREREIYA